MATPDYVAIIKEHFPNVNAIAYAVGLPDVSNPYSKGAQWLKEAAYYYEYDWERILSSGYPQDEIQYEPLTPATAEQWEIFADLQLWRYQADVTYCETAEFRKGYGTESIPAIRVDDIPELAGKLLAELFNQISNVILYLLQEQLVTSDE